MKKIMFNDKYGLTEAVLEGRKTQTRRIVSIHKHIQILIEDEPLSDKNKLYICEKFSKYKIGEEVAIAQRYSECFRAVCLENSKGWNNKMFVMAELMPHRIKITNIRVERLQDISEEDCLKEGVDLLSEEFIYYGAKDAFAILIDKVIGIGTWDSNPYVFVYDFELIK